MSHDGTHSRKKKPIWLQLGDELIWASVGVALDTLNKHRGGNLDLDTIPQLAICHLAGCLQASMEMNQQGAHSTAICLFRQCVEAITVFELGLQDSSFAYPHLQAWKDGQTKHGEIRASLERKVWPSYGSGLWDEPWAQFFGNLARAVQPYSHYTNELMGWQFARVGPQVDLKKGGKFFVTMGLKTYDPVLASRITLLHVLVGWTICRILLAHGKHPQILKWSDKIAALGKALSRSKLLFEKENWGVQLAPHVFFMPGHDWIDE